MAVTGASSGIGRALAERLVALDEVKRVIGVDEHRGDVDGVEWRVLDVRDPAIAQRIARCDVVVHLDVEVSPDSDPRQRSERNVRGAQTVLTAAAAAGVPRVVVCTSAMVYGAFPDNPVPLEDDGPLRARPEGVVADLLEIEWLARRAPKTHPGLSVTVVRPSMLVGPGIDTFLTRHFEAARLLVIRGSRPSWQFCHVDDLVSALEYAVLGRVEGPVTVGCEGFLEQDEIETLFGLPRLELPESLALGAAERLHRLGLTPAPASDLAYVSHPWVVSSAKLTAAGWRPTYDNATACEVLATEVAGRHAAFGRRIGRRETATLGAAGATVALLGTAAVVRRARRRRTRGGT
ncbi:NAD-dependent epimerase/dehydratase family protein [Actinopolymorpha alba]|uniref:NAD-dependent epimerase/dehydratase family protein n=1 Tax=Actinopolymorpha alba TaxID=533267 RepID=UPI000382C62A|nr:NAD-dependent epimerase/dehydratase family protein [Actinopolymorpha alba]